MRRFLATLLLSVLGSPAVILLALADTELQQPACCRRGGKHQCAMNSPSPDSSPEPVLRAVRSICPYFPSAGTVPAYQGPAKLEASSAIFAALISHPAVHAQGEARARISCTRTHQKRGPPIVS